MIRLHRRIVSIALFLGMAIGVSIYALYKANYWESAGDLPIIAEHTGITSDPIPASYEAAIKLVDSKLLELDFESIDNPLGYRRPVSPGTPIETHWYRGAFNDSQKFYVVSQLATDQGSGTSGACMHYFSVHVVWEFRGFRPSVERNEEKGKDFIGEMIHWWGSAKG